VNAEPLPAQEETPGQFIVRRTGVIVGLVGVAELIYGFVASPPGQLRFQVTGLILGALIFFSGQALQALVRWLAWMSVLPLGLSLLGQLALIPGALLAAQWRAMPLTVAGYYANLVMLLALAVFVTRQLGRPEVLAERRAAGRKMRDMRWPLALGLLAGLGSVALQYRMLNGEEARQAVQMAAAKLGPRYHYYANGVWISYGKDTIVSATVQAWNDEELLQLPLHWTK